MASRERTSYRFPRLGTGFRGEYSAEGPTDEAYQIGFLKQLRNYHLQGRGRLQKRKGHKPTIATTINGAAVAVQGLGVYDDGTSRYLVGVSNGKVKYNNGTTWTDITGTLTPQAGDNLFVRFERFTQGSTTYLVGTGPLSGTATNRQVWKWAGTGNATGLYVGAEVGSVVGPTFARDVCEFRGRLFAIGTDTSPYIVEYSDDGVLDSWADGNYFYCTRGSMAMGLTQHNDGVLLVFHQKSVHRVEFSYDATTGEVFTRQLVDGSVGAISTPSICTSKGVTYFAGPNGPYRIRSAFKPAEFIGTAIRDLWATLNPTRLQYIQAFERGAPFDEVVFLVSTGSNDQHNAALIYNTSLDAWSIFDSTYGYLLLNCGVNFTNSNGRQVTMCGRYDGKVSECWGDDNYDTGNLDDDTTGAVVQTLVQTGDLDFGYDGLKRLREMWLDLLLTDSRTFSLQITTTGGTIESTTPTAAIGNPAARLSVDFVFDSSAFASGSSVQARLQKSVKARKFQFGISETASGPPHTINSMTFWYLPRSRNFKAIV